jgi:hypothetical protein
MRGTVASKRVSCQFSISSLVSDRRGSGFVQMIVLMVALALALLVAARVLSGGLSDKLVCTGDAIVSLTPGGGRCAEGSGPGEGLVPEAVAGADEGAGDPRPGNGDDIESVDVAPGGDPGQPGQGQPDQPGQEREPAAEEDDSGVKIGGEGSVRGFDNGEQSNGQITRGGAPAKTPEQIAQDSRTKGVDPKAEVGVERTLFDEKGALAETTFAGGSETLSGGFASTSGKVFANANAQDGVAAGGRVEGKVSAVNLEGKHELPGGIEESHEVDVLSVKGSLEAKAGISKDVVGATVSGEAGANLAEASVEAKKVIKIPFTDVGIEIGGSGSASAGANIGGQATGGFFKGEDGKSRVGLSAGFKAALGLGLGGKLSLNAVF